MKLSKKVKFNLFILLIVLNIVLRIPFYPHEYGADSFEIHILANSVSEFGCAKWWVEPLSLSIPGLYPYSECSTVPFIISGISQTMGIDIEKVIFIFCIILGLFTVFAAYILAGVIWDSDLFKFSVAFGLSTCPAILNYLTWTITTRVLFIALLPFFVYLLLKIHIYKLRFEFLTVIMFILLYATHQLVYFLIPVCIGYLITIIFYKLKGYMKSKYIEVKIPQKYITSTLIIGYFTMFAIPFITGHFIEGSRYEAPLDLFLGSFPRYVGVFGVLSIGGFVYLLFRDDKRFEEWCLLFFLMFLTPFLYVQTYMKWFIPCFIIPFAGIGLINILKIGKRKKSGYAILVVVILLLLSVSFSGFYQHWRTKGGDIYLFEGYMEESTYTTGLWIKQNINNGSLICNGVIGNMVFAVSEVPQFTGSCAIDQVYGYANVSEAELKKRSITTEEYWFGGPYELLSWESEIHRREVLLESYKDYEEKYGTFNLTHIIESKKIPHGSFVYHGINPSKFLNYVYDKNGCVYDNGKVCIWRCL